MELVVITAVIVRDRFIEVRGLVDLKVQAVEVYFCHRLSLELQHLDLSRAVVTQAEYWRQRVPVHLAGHLFAINL